MQTSVGRVGRRSWATSRWVATCEPAGEPEELSTQGGPDEAIASGLNTRRDFQASGAQSQGSTTDPTGRLFRKGDG
jgi:hypothetical protein